MSVDTSGLPSKVPMQNKIREEAESGDAHFFCEYLGFGTLLKGTSAGLWRCPGTSPRHGPAPSRVSSRHRVRVLIVTHFKYHHLKHPLMFNCIEIFYLIMNK